MSLNNYLDRFFANRRWSHRKLYKQPGFRMLEITSILYKINFLHCFQEHTTFGWRKSCVNHIQIHGDVFTVAIDGDTCTTTEDNIYALLAKMILNKCCQFRSSHFTNRFHSGLPRRLGLRLTTSSFSLSSVGQNVITFLRRALSSLMNGQRGLKEYRRVRPTARLRRIPPNSSLSS